MVSRSYAVIRWLGRRSPTKIMRTNQHLNWVTLQGSERLIFGGLLVVNAGRGCAFTFYISVRHPATHHVE
ncbi:hypothetical protein BDW02DRAFT_121711 [Decorospora gaudefroyi]|uniref:Uncharacterized protein n=1 Tax=Decorospora gaudefroyi TaxID=184978 RepID=A0A6A5KRB5_9PLEO|nr:hypothetical protein BDW02DRAFT_121711 [Decorospora gaudefroyi]